MNITEITEISRLMAKYGITEFKAESEGSKIKLKREVNVVAAPVAAAPVASLPTAAAPAAVPVEATEVSTAETIDAPIVGTFYTSPGPEQPAFVKVGDIVSEDTVVCIVEAMKVMNEIKAGKSGEIKKVLLSDGTPVEFGQPLFEIV
jgi:acetyl-CoA carboxylase biotin carboxyl carrier protein